MTTQVYCVDVCLPLEKDGMDFNYKSGCDTGTELWVRRTNFIFADSLVATYAYLGDWEDANTPGTWTTAQKKLFLEDGSAELYMNIDRNAGIISFPEKDSANRADLIAAFIRAIKK